VRMLEGAKVVLAMACVAVVAVVLAAPSRAFSPSSAKCPSASVVGGALGLKVKSPTSSVTPFSKICTYAGGGLVPTKITFQEDTAATFAAGEKAVGSTLVKVSGLGKAAWTTKVGGTLEVFNGNETLKILAPAASATRLEGLARKIPGF
jgi:hypothetical protein